MAGAIGVEYARGLHEEADESADLIVGVVGVVVAAGVIDVAGVIGVLVRSV